jgi:outer membrane protein assembly factor BamD
MIQSLRRPAALLAPALVVVALSMAGCGSKKDVLPTGITEVDKFLYDKGRESLEKKRWYTAREYFQRIVDNYPQSPYRPDAKIGVGDAFLGEGSTESLTLAIAEFKEFLTFYPTHARADYAQYKLGMCHFKQMRSPQRDQSESRRAVEELQTFVERYPNSELMSEVQEKLRLARDRVSTAEYQVGYFYFKQRWYPGAIERLRGLAKSDPGFTNRDAVYFHLAESLMKMNMAAEALPYYDRLTKEFETSEYLVRARERLAEFKPIAPAAPGAAAPAGATAPPGEKPAADAAVPAPTSDVVVPPPVSPKPPGSQP